MTTSNDKNSSSVSQVPDPEDTFDDFDDVLEQFNQPRPSTTKPAFASTITKPVPASTISEPPSASTSADAVPESDLMSDEFAKELADGMANLMREIAGSGSEPSLGEKGKDAGENGELSEEQRQALKAAWEAMLIEGLGEPGDEDKTKDGQSFQETIKKAMDKLKESEDNVRSSTSTTGTGGSEDELAELLAKFGKDGGSEDMTNFLENMMGQLMSKEILYEPLKELSDSFPPYLTKTDLSPDDRNRYEQQLVYVHKILAEFDKPTYKDDDPVCSKTIADLMAQMQEYGQPPSEVMGPLPPGLDFSGEKLPDDCVVA